MDIVGKLGYYLPWSVGCSVLTSVGAGLLSILTPSSGTGKWVGFQILIGFGRGCGVQMVCQESRANFFARVF
jgi:hypothetical protein